MANTITSGAGLLGARVYILDTNGYPDGAQTGLTSSYAGIPVSNVKSIDLPGVENVQVIHRGNNYVIGQDALPPADVPRGTMTTASLNQTLDTALVGTVVETIGEANMDLLDTNKQGDEKDAALLYWRQALDTDPSSSSFGARRWQTFLISKTRIAPRGGNAVEDAADENAYGLFPTPVRAAAWGKAFTDVTNGATRGVRMRLTAEFPMVMEKWEGNGTGAVLTCQHTPISAAKTEVWVEGVAATVSSVDTAAKTITLSAPPTYTNRIVGLFETSDDISED